MVVVRFAKNGCVLREFGWFSSPFPKERPGEAGGRTGGSKLGGELLVVVCKEQVMLASFDLTTHRGMIMFGVSKTWSSRIPFLFVPKRWLSSTFVDANNL